MPRKKWLLLALATILVFSTASALYCSRGDSGGKLLNFTYECFGRGEITISCDDGSERGQCYQRSACEVVNCAVGTSGLYGSDSCRADCGEETTYVEISCRPLELVAPTVTLHFEEYSGQTVEGFTIEGFGFDSQLVKDIYFEPVEGCDLNNVKTGLGTTFASVKTEFSCSQPFSEREITLVVKDECKAEASETALLSVEEYCPNECVARLYPQCRTGEFIECFDTNGCTFLEKTECEHGCRGEECCQPLSCTDLNFECGEAINDCDENVSCGVCAEGLACFENKCIEESLVPQPVELPFALPFPINFSDLFLIVPLIVVAVVIAFVLRAVAKREEE